jgi:photosystem II stability/assembly factor-like uncharacterized protein
MKPFPLSPARRFFIIPALLITALFFGYDRSRPVRAQAPNQTITEALFKSLQFRALGPAIMGGRIDDFAVAANNPHIIYAATASGGLWKTTNNGTTWEPLFDNQPVSSIGDVTLAPSNPDIVWVGTGEANNRQSSSWGNGVYKSTDGGKTWEHVGLKDSHHIGRIVIHPQNPNIVYVAAAGHLWGPNSERGLYKTTDGGKTWTNIKFINEDTGFIDVAIDPSEPETLYAAAYQRRRTPFGFNGGGPGSGLYKTTDGGARWTKLTNGLPAGDAGRIGIDVWLKDPKIVYVTYEHATESGVYRSDDKGATWQKMSNINPRPMYYSQIRIDPQNDQRLYLLGASWYVSENGGRGFTPNRFLPIHGDFHALWINPANPNHMIAGSDGGIHFSYDKGKTWDYFNTIPLGQFYEVSFDFRKPYWIYGGLQDNGSWGAPSSTLTHLGVTNDEWIRVGGGDGFYTQVDPNDPNIVYAESQNAGIFRLSRATSEAKSIRPQAPEGERFRFDWNAPILISPHNARTIYLAGNRLFISNNRGDDWEWTPDLTKNQDRDKLAIMGAVPKANVLSGHDGQETFGHIVTIAESPMKKGVLWAGTDDGNLQVSRDGGKTWKNVIDKVPGLPTGTYVTRVIASHVQEGRAYVTFDGHRNDDFKPYVFVTENFGESWQAITNGLPHPTHVIREHPRNPNLLFAGTEFGLWVSFSRGAVWMLFKSNLPTVPVDDIAIHPRENDLILGTHGRSIWVLDDITPLEQMTENVAASAAHLFDIRPATAWRLYNHKGSTGNKTFAAPNPPYGAIISYYLHEKPSEAVKLTISDKAGNVIREMTGTNDPGVQRVVWDLRYGSPIQMIGQASERAQTPSQASAAMTMGGGFSLARGPRVTPGVYAVRLAIGAQQFTKTVKIEEDPRIWLTPAELAVRLQTLLAINKLQKSAFETQRSLVSLSNELKSLQDNLKKQPTAPEILIKAAEALAAQVSELHKRVMPQMNAQIFSENAGPSEQPAVPPILSRLSQLFAALDGYSEPPSATQREQMQKLTAQLNMLIEQTNKIIREDVPNLNKQVAESGAAPIKTGEPIAPLQR